MQQVASRPENENILRRLLSVTYRVVALDCIPSFFCAGIRLGCVVPVHPAVLNVGPYGANQEIEILLSSI